MPVTINGTTGMTGDVVGNATTATRFQTAPAFSAFNNATQSIAATTFTKVSLQSEEFDTNNAFDATTNFRFLPLVAGYYQISGGFTTTAAAQCYASIYKNGSIAKAGPNIVNAGSSTVSALIYLNGSTDFVELFAFTGAAATIAAGASLTYFQGVLVKPA